MCGICGIMNLGDDRPVEKALLVRMADTLTHRGPDSEGYFMADKVRFGFRRLSIIDLCGGNQPMSNEDQSVHLICNGEIFNYRALRHELLAKGHQFRSQSDVEVLVHLYEDEGEELLHRLNGQFAFAIYDEPRGRLLLARDHFGVIPLFYTVVGDTLIFASEIKAILAHPSVERRVDLTGLDQVLSLPGLVSPRTMFTGITSLPPGHFLEVSHGNVRAAEYWDVPYPCERELTHDKPESYYVDGLEGHLLQSVRYRLQADVPAGAYLSGGLDSSLITSMMKVVSPEPKTTFSIGFEDAFFAEEKYQRLMSNHVGFPHQQIPFNTHDIEDSLQQVIWHCECPLKESYNAATLALSNAAYSQNVRVVLSGEGADELFAGYPSYRFDAFRRQHGWSRPVAPEESALRQQLWGDPDFHYETEQYAFKSVKRSLFSGRANELYSEFDFTRYGVIQPKKLRGLHVLHKRSYLDMKLRLADHLLADPGDRMLLAHSVEGRYPFLDIGLINFAARIPPALKLNGFREKYILRKVGEKYLPREIVDREKFPFAAPGSPHLLQRNTDWIEDLLSYETIERQGYFNPAEVERLKKKYSTPGFMLSIPQETDLLMIILTFGIFLESFGMPNL
jgi:asparagine synthase (glutamine-hydrolysing)